MANKEFSKPYFENLDALRFFAFLSVFLSHCFLFFNYTFPNKYLQLLHRHYLLNGYLGVSFFLVLSGFLITWLLLLEKTGNGGVQVPAFYMRRVLRIWPVYFMVVAAGFMIGTHLSSPLLDQNDFPYKIQLSQLKWYVLFLANYDLIHNGASSAPLNTLWSVSIEEQFYLVWPLVFLIFDRKALPYLCWTLIIGSFVYRCFHHPTAFPTFAIISDLAAGGLIAYYCLYSSSMKDFFKRLSRKSIALIYFLFFMYIPGRGFAHIFGPHIYLIYYPFEELIMSGFFCFIILEQIYSQNSFFKFGRIQTLNRLGRISYGLYAYHMFTFPLLYFAADQLGLPSNSFGGYLFKVVFAFGLTILLAALSYRYFEKKILSLKKYFQPSRVTLTEKK